MSGIKGQPSPKPSSLASPNPQKDELDHALEQLQQGGQAVQAGQSASAQMNAPAPQGTPAPAPQGDELDQALSQMQQSQPQPQQGDQFESPWYTRYLPDVGGIVGGIGGALAGLPSGPGAIATELGGAAAGGMVGKAAQDYLDTKFNGKPAPESVGAEAQDIALEGGKQGLQQGVGLGLAKGLKLGAHVVADSIVKPALDFIGDAVGKAKDEITKPIMDVIGSKTSNLTVEESGDQAKKMLIDHIQQKYAPFTKAYSDISKVTQAMPIEDEARRGLTNQIKSWALDNFTGDQYKMIAKFADDIDAAGNGKQLDNIIKGIGDAQNSAFEKRMTNQGTILKELKGMVTQFAEDQTEKIAKAIQAGKATPEQMQFMSQLAQQQGIQEANPGQYAKAIASDFLKGKEKIKTDYKGFREFLSNIGEQTKLNADKMGPAEIIGKLNDIPSEKLMDKMFDPKNAAALRTMQKETPEIFNTVVQSKMNQLIEKASSAEGKLDLNKLNKALGSLPKPTREILMNSDELKLLNNVVSDPKLARLNKLEEKGGSYIQKWANELAGVTTAAQIAAGKAGGTKLGAGAGAAATNLLGKGATTVAPYVGGAARTLYDTMIPQNDQGSEGQ